MNAKITVLSLFLTVSLVALAPPASAGNAYAYSCSYDTSSAEYNCAGYGVNNAGELCYVEWADDDTNDDWEDANAFVHEIRCGGDLLRDPIPPL